MDVGGRECLEHILEDKSGHWIERLDLPCLGKLPSKSRKNLIHGLFGSKNAIVSLR